MTFPVTDLTRVSPTLDSRAITFENPTGERGAGGSAAGERIVLADIVGPGTIRHIWMTFDPAPPEVMRAKFIEIFYDGAEEPSVSVPVIDLCGVPWGRPVHLDSALAVIGEGRGFNSFVPMPFKGSTRVEFVNASARPTHFFFQIDYTLEPELPEGTGYLHVTFRRQNPTVLKDDFVIVEGLAGPGRFLGSVVGVRVLDGGVWYGEGEVKMYIDGDGALPTICGTGLEDYVGSAWGLGPHQTRYMGAPLDVRDPEGTTPMPDFVGFYRWHVLDPIMFARALKISIQQIGFEVFLEGQEDEMARKEPAGSGWITGAEQMPIPETWGGSAIAMGIAERADDYCATAFVMCAEPQPVPRVTAKDALTDIERKPYEQPLQNEALHAALEYHSQADS